MKLSDPLVIFTLAMVGLTGVLLLAAHQADEAGHKRAGVVLIFAAVGSLISVVIGPYGMLGLVMIACLYGLFLGLPIAGLVLLVRRARRRGT